MIAPFLWVEVKFYCSLYYSFLFIYSQRHLILYNLRFSNIKCLFKTTLLVSLVK
jgi:hypothetical protein